MPDNNQKTDLEKRLNEAKKRASQRTTTVKYQNDTIKVTPYNYQTSAYYETSTGRMVRNVTSMTEYKSETALKAEISHEAKHATNAALGLPDVSAEQFYKLAALDEVSAHIVSALTWREKYLSAPNKKQFLDDCLNTNLSTIVSEGIPLAYFEAIRDGEINPESKDPKEFDKEMELIAREEFNNLADKSSSYVKDFKNLTRGYMNRDDKKFQTNDAEFERFAKHYMTISGIDFRKYLPKDATSQIYIPDDIHSASQNLEKTQDADEAQVIASGGLIYNGKISLEQYHKLLQHQEIAHNILYNHRDSKERAALAAGDRRFDSSIKDTYDVFKGMVKEKDIKPSMDLALSRANGNVPDNNEEYERLLKQIYTIPGTNVDLREHIENFDAENLPLKESSAIDEFLKAPEKYKQNHPYERHYQGVLTHHEGEPEWQQADENNKVSDVQTMEAFDGSGDFLAAEREQRALAAELEELKRKEQEQQALETLEPLYPKKNLTTYAPIGDGIVIQVKNPEFKSAELKTTINDADGSSTEVTLLDGKKHGLEITRDNEGNITGYKVYNHGQEVDTNKHTIELNTKNENGLTAISVTLDGQKFGSEIVKDNTGNNKIAFYEEGGALIQGSKNAVYTRKHEHINDPHATLRNEISQIQVELPNNPKAEAQNMRFDMHWSKRTAPDDSKGIMTKPTSEKQETQDLITPIWQKDRTD